MATRIQNKSRHGKRVMATATYSISTGAVTEVKGRMPKLDPRGFPGFGGVNNPVSVKLTAIA